MTPPSDKMSAPLCRFFALLCSYDCQYKSNKLKNAQKNHKMMKNVAKIVWRGGVKMSAPPRPCLS